MGQLAEWKCHKIVKAGKIITIPTPPDDQHSVAFGVEDCNGAECSVAVPHAVLMRGRPAVGDYIVIYDDGYKSWSPAKAFEDGYTRKP